MSLTVEALAQALANAKDRNETTDKDKFLAGRLLPFIERQIAAGQQSAGQSLELDHIAELARQRMDDGVGHHGEQWRLGGRTAINFMMDKLRRLATPQPPKPAGAVPLPEKFAPTLKNMSGGVFVPSMEKSESGQFCYIDDAIRYGDAREAAGRAGAVPAGWVVDRNEDGEVRVVGPDGGMHPRADHGPQSERLLHALAAAMIAAPLPQQPTAEGERSAFQMVEEQEAAKAGREAVAFTHPENLADGSHPNRWEMYRTGEQSPHHVGLYTHPSPVADAEALKVGNRVVWTDVFDTEFPGKIVDVVPPPAKETRFNVALDDGSTVCGATPSRLRRLTGADHG